MPLFLRAMLGIIVDFAPRILIILIKEIVYVLILRVLTEVPLHYFYGDRIQLHVINISGYIIEYLISALCLEICNDALFAGSARILFVPCEEPVDPLHHIDYHFSVLAAALQCLEE